MNKEKIYYFIKSYNPSREAWQGDMEGQIFIEGLGWMHVFFPTLREAKKFIKENSKTTSYNLEIIRKKFSFK